MPASPRYSRFTQDEHDDLRKVYSSMYFRTAPTKRVYSKDPYKVLNLLGDMGGLLDIIMAFGVLITIGYVKRAFARSLLGDAYQVQSYSENLTEFYPSKSARVCLKKVRQKETEAELNNTQLKAEDLQIKLTSTENSFSEEEDEFNDSKQEIKVVPLNDSESDAQNKPKNQLDNHRRRGTQFISKKTLNNLDIPISTATPGQDLHHDDSVRSLGLHKELVSN